MSAIKASLVRDLAAALSPAPDNVGHRGRPWVSFRGRVAEAIERHFDGLIAGGHLTQASWPGPLIIYAAWGVPSDLPFGETWAMALAPDGSVIDDFDDFNDLVIEFK